jgi:hypothetical protein
MCRLHQVCQCPTNSHRVRKVLCTSIPDSVVAETGNSPQPFTRRGRTMNITCGSMTVVFQKELCFRKLDSVAKPMDSVSLTIRPPMSRSLSSRPQGPWHLHLLFGCRRD